MIEIQETILDNITLFEDINYTELLRIGLIPGFIVSLTIGLLSLAIYYSLKALKGFK